ARRHEAQAHHQRRPEEELPEDLPARGGEPVAEADEEGDERPLQAEERTRRAGARLVLQQAEARAAQPGEDEERQRERAAEGDLGEPAELPERPGVHEEVDETDVQDNGGQQPPPLAVLQDQGRVVRPEIQDDAGGLGPTEDLLEEEDHADEDEQSHRGGVGAGERGTAGHGAPVYARSTSSALRKSSGIGASKRIVSPVDGWGKASECACRACRPMAASACLATALSLSRRLRNA